MSARRADRRCSPLGAATCCHGTFLCPWEARCLTPPRPGLQSHLWDAGGRQQRGCGCRANITVQNARRRTRQHGARWRRLDHWPGLRVEPRRADPPGGPSTASLRIPAAGEPKGGSRVDAPRQGSRGVPPIRRDAAPPPRYPPARMQICSARARSSLPDATPTSTPLASASATRRAASSSRRKRRAISRRAARVTAQAKPAWVP